MEKEEKVDRGPGTAITFENLVGIGSLLIYIDRHRKDKHGEPWLFSEMSFLSNDGDESLRSVPYIPSPNRFQFETCIFPYSHHIQRYVITVHTFVEIYMFFCSC